MTLRRKFTQTKLFRALIAAAFLLFCIIFQPRFIMEPLRAVLATVSWPIHGVFSSLAFEIRDGVHFLSSIGELKRENERLHQETVRLMAENTKWQAVASENEELRQELALLPRETFDLKAAQVIGRDAAGAGNWLTVDQGTRQGIKRGMPAIAYGSVLIGRVTEVFPESARIMPLTHPDSVVSGVTVPGQAQGIVKGEYGLGILFDMVLQDTTLQSSDRLVTSGLGGELPQDLFIGTLQAVRLSPDHLYQQASVIPPVDFSSLRYVFIIKNTQ
ncbi:MAG: rod shape-determining protein MreC [Candidatus Moranbacteria bacterium]|nr:rod shape-determining protein MreC [Candidatus Moranbacteria bacterium]